MVDFVEDVSISMARIFLRSSLQSPNSFLNAVFFSFHRSWIIHHTTSNTTIVGKKGTSENWQMLSRTRSNLSIAQCHFVPITKAEKPTLPMQQTRSSSASVFGCRSWSSCYRGYPQQLSRHKWWKMPSANKKRITVFSWSGRNDPPGPCKLLPTKIPTRIWQPPKNCESYSHLHDDSIYQKHSYSLQKRGVTRKKTRWRSFSRCKLGFCPRTD